MTDKTPPANTFDPEEGFGYVTPEWVEAIRAKQARAIRAKQPRFVPNAPIPLDRELIENFRSTGPGWQSRLQAALNEKASKS